MTRPVLLKCTHCGIPQLECFDKLERGESFHDKEGYYSIWRCPTCLDESVVRCSHCDGTFSDGKPLPEPLDDGSFLCPECDKKLKEELDDFQRDG